MRVFRTFLCTAIAVCAGHHADAQPAEEAEPASPPALPPAAPTPAPPAKTTVTVAGTVEAPELDAPLAGATVTVVGSELSTVTDDAGHYSLEIPPGNVRLRVDFAGFGSEEKPVNLALGDTVELGFALKTATLNETIVVVGSRTPRTNVDSPVPVDVVTAEEIARSGRTETGRVLHALAASYLSTPQTIADGSDHVDPASLRGLGPDQVLILVNGKRRHRSALMHVNGTFGRGTVGTDLNAIAVGSIKRIEILRDGAAAQYGSDAIAGVINIVTKDVTDLLDVTSETGITAKRDGAQLKASANYGFKLGDKGGFLNLTGEFLQRGATNRAGAYTGTVFSADPATEAMLLAGRSPAEFGMQIGEASATSGIAAYNLELPISDVARFYSFGDLGHRRGSSAGFRRYPREQEKTVPDFYPEGFLPLIQPTIDDAAICVGVRRKGTWNVDASLTHGRNAFQFNIEDSVNASLGTASPTTFDAGTLAYEETLADLDLLHKVEQKAFHAVNLVVGSELRVERYRIEAGDEASYIAGPDTYLDAMGNPQPKVPGAQVFPGFQPSNEVDRRRDAIGLYAGVESELTKKIALDVGGRFERYSDFGRSLIGKAAGRVKVVGPLALRGGISTGFRAPSLQQLWFSNISTQFLATGPMGALVATQVLTPNNASPITREGFRIPQLREERSLNASGGLTLKSGGNFSLTADGYFIRLRDRIVLTSPFPDSDPTVAALLAPFAGVNQAQFFANAVDTDTTGVDVVADYATGAGDGTLALTASLNFTKTEVTDINIPSSLLARFGGDRATVERFYFGRLARNRIEDSVPHQKGTVAVRYTVAGLTALARANYYGKVFYKPDNAANDEVFGAKVLFDLDVGYQATKNVLVTLGADNLFNTFPDEQQKEANISSGRFLYSRNVTQFGQNGGFYYAKLELTFF